MYWLQAITPLHVGAGKGVGFIDLPIMREKVTNWPLVPGSAVKGVMRDHFEQREKVESNLISAAFGKADKDNESNAGSLVLTDAHIVCMPVRSLYGTFAYTTSPLVLERLKRDLEAAGYNDLPQPPSPKVDSEAFFTTDKIVHDNRIFFEDLDFNATPDENTNKWADKLAKILFSTDTKWQTIFKERFAILSDDSFNFLAETTTEIAARIRIEPEKKIVKQGALWYEESLPTETILAGIAWCDKVYGGNGISQERIIETFCNNSGLNLQIGGKATVGKGRVKCLFTEG